MVDLLDIIDLSNISIKIHLKYLEKHQLINISGTFDIDETINVSITDFGYSFYHLLKDIKYQTMYESKLIGENHKGSVNKKCTAYYNRHALNVVYLMHSNENANNITDILKIVHFSEKALKVHLANLISPKYRENALLSKNNESYFTTDFGNKVSRILRDIKYQSIYNSKYN